MVAWGPLFSNLANAGSFLQGVGGVASLFGDGGNGLDEGAMVAQSKNALRWQLRYDKQRLSAIREGAKEAGIHPIYALGGGSGSFSAPIAVDGSGPSMADRMAAAGSDIYRAATQMDTEADRLQKRLLLAQIEGQEIDNAYAASRVARDFQSTQLAPPIPSSGPRNIPMSDRFAVSPSGKKYPIPSEEYSMILENDPTHIPIYWWQMFRDTVGAAVRNKASGYFSKGYRAFTGRR